MILTPQTRNLRWGEIGMSCWHVMRPKSCFEVLKPRTLSNTHITHLPVTPDLAQFVSDPTQPHKHVFKDVGGFFSVCFSNCGVWSNRHPPPPQNKYWLFRGVKPSDIIEYLHNSLPSDPMTWHNPPVTKHTPHTHVFEDVEGTFLVIVYFLKTVK